MMILTVRISKKYNEGIHYEFQSQLNFEKYFANYLNTTYMCKFAKNEFSSQFYFAKLRTIFLRTLNVCNDANS